MSTVSDEFKRTKRYTHLNQNIMKNLIPVLAIVFVLLNIYAFNHFASLNIIPANAFFALVIISAVAAVVTVGAWVAIKFNK